MQSTIGQDVKFAWRGLYRSPTFTAVAVLALALGIGANSAIFSVVNAVLLSPLPYDRSEDLVRIWSSWTQFPRGSVSEPEYYDYRESDSIEALAAFTFPHDATLAVEGGEPVSADVPSGPNREQESLRSAAVARLTPSFLEVGLDLRAELPPKGAGTEP